MRRRPSTEARLDLAPLMFPLGCRIVPGKHLHKYTAAELTSENSVKAKFGCAPARSVYRRRDHNTSGRNYPSLMYNRLRTSDPLHKKTGSPGGGWSLGGPNCASKFSRSPNVTSRNRSQQIHATGVARVSPIGDKTPA